MSYKQIMIDTIREYQYYELGSLESMSEDRVREIYEDMIDWIG